jgi:hypothetical protein
VKVIARVDKQFGDQRVRTWPRRFPVGGPGINPSSAPRRRPARCPGWRSPAARHRRRSRVPIRACGRLPRRSGGQFVRRAPDRHHKLRQPIRPGNANRALIDYVADMNGGSNHGSTGAVVDGRGTFEPARASISRIGRLVPRKIELPRVPASMRESPVSPACTIGSSTELTPSQRQRRPETAHLSAFAGTGVAGDRICAGARTPCRAATRVRRGRQGPPRGVW